MSRRGVAPRVLAFIVVGGCLAAASPAAAATCGSVANSGLLKTCGKDITAVEGQAFSGTVAAAPNVTTKLGPKQVLSETVTIAWGDGTQSVVPIPQHTLLTNDSEQVAATHTYTEEGIYKLALTTVARVGGLSVVLSKATASATVSDAPLTASGRTFTANLNQPFSGAVASLSDGNPGATASDFTATITWGDGTTSPGTVAQVGAQLTVSGNHTYSDPKLASASFAGQDTPVSVSIADAGGATATAASHVHLPLQASAVSVQAGSSLDITLPSDLASIRNLSATQAGTPAGVTFVTNNGLLSLTADSSVQPGSFVSHLSGQACSSAACSIPFDLDVPVTVTALGAPAGQVESFSDPSPDRVAAAVDNQLQDELLMTVGTDAAPGTRSQADAAAAAAGGTVAGGLSDAGIYQVRWESPQDLSTRTTELEQQPGVAAVAPDTVGLVDDQSYAPIVSPSFDQSYWTWRYDAINARPAWQLSTGSDITVGLIDPDNVDADQTDLNVHELDGVAVPGTHATHTAGLACAKANNDGMAGIAWGCQIDSLRLQAPACAHNPCQGGEGISTDGDVLAAMRRIASVSDVRVVNMSIGPTSGCYDDAQAQADSNQIDQEAPIYQRVLNGVGGSIVWTMSAGNNCAPQATSPQAANAGLPNVITVASENSDQRLSSFSNYGTDVDLAAPGGVVPTTPAVDLHSDCSAATVQKQGQCGLLSTTYMTCPQGFCDGYVEEAGTSMAAPVVAGVAALVISANPSLTAGQAAKCITATAGDSSVGSTLPPDGQPGGAYATPSLPYSGSPIPIVDALAAVQCAKNGGTPVAPPSPPAGAAAALSTAYGHSCAALNGGSVDCWGDNLSGDLGNPATISSSPTPVQVNSINDATATAIGIDYSCAQRSTGAVACWGDNTSGYLGNNTETPSTTPVGVVNLNDAIGISAGTNFTCALRSDQTVSCWGANNVHQLGTTSVTTRGFAEVDHPVAVGISGVRQIASGGDHSCAADTDGTVQCWGGDQNGELGNGTTSTVGVGAAVPVTGISTAISVAAGESDSCALLNDGTIRCWGANDAGQLGNGTTTPSATPVKVTGITNAIAVAVGNSHACAALANGVAECWGRGGNGQLGTGATTSSPTPTAVLGVTNATGVSAGDYHSCVLHTPGTISCFGADYDGQLGDGATAQETAPVAVKNIG